MSAPHPAAAYIERRNRNLAFFAGNYPGIYSYFKDYNLQRLQLDIRPEAAEVDVIENGQHVYGGSAKAYGRKEGQAFSEAFPPGKCVQALDPIYQGEYQNPRFFASHMRALYQLSPLTPAQFKGYQVQAFLPFVVCLGVGLGYHIESLLEARDVRHLTVVEHDMDRFAASLYTVDWQSLVETFNKKSGQLDFLIINNAENWYQVRAAVWNRLIEQCPLFPLSTFFYNHLGHSEYGAVIDDINRDIYVHLFSFGNYDDEVNQLNNAIHNFKAPIPKLPGSEAFVPLKDRESAICIVGSGPSLDGRVEEIKALQSRALVMSCGTGLGALLSHGIEPDLHIELESDYITYRAQSRNEHLDTLKSTRLIGAAQLNPRLFELFGEARLFFKAESPLSGLFAEAGEAIKDTAPTCTNAGIALAAHYGFKRLYLFGLDYGFPKAEEHHAKGAIYYTDKAHERDLETIEQQIIEVDAAAGGKISSTTFLYTSRRRTENVIVATQHKAIFNCSDGARIEGTQWLSPGQVSGQLDQLADTRGQAVGLWFGEEPSLVPAALIDAKKRFLSQQLQSLCDHYAELLAHPPANLSEMTDLCMRLNQHLQKTILPKHESFYYFARGSVWHFLHAGYSHALALLDERDRQDWIVWWYDRFTAFMAEWPAHLAEVLAKSAEEDDPWLDLSIQQAESEAYENYYIPSRDWRASVWEYDAERGFQRKAEV